MEALVAGFEKQAHEMGFNEDFILGFEKSIDKEAAEAAVLFHVNKKNPQFISKVSEVLTLLVGTADAKEFLKQAAGEEGEEGDVAKADQERLDANSTAGGLTRGITGKNYGTGLGDLPIGGRMAGAGIGMGGGGLLGLIIGALTGQTGIGMTLGGLLGGGAGAMLWPKIFPKILGWLQSSGMIQHPAVQSALKDPQTPVQAGLPGGKVEGATEGTGENAPSTPPLVPTTLPAAAPKAAQPAIPKPAEPGESEALPKTESKITPESVPSLSPNAKLEAGSMAAAEKASIPTEPIAKTVHKPDELTLGEKEVTPMPAMPAPTHGALNSFREAVGAPTIAGPTMLENFRDVAGVKPPTPALGK